MSPLEKDSSRGASGLAGRITGRLQAIRVRWPRRLFYGLVLVAFVFLLVFLWLYHFRNDEFLARFIMRNNNSSLRGRLEIKRVHWTPRALLDLALGTPTPVTIDHFAVYDPWGKEVIFAPRAEGRIALLPMVTKGSLIVHHLVVPTGRCLITARAGRRGSEVNLPAAFSTVTPSGGAGPQVELREFEFHDVNLSLRFEPYWSLTLPHVATGGTLILNGRAASDPAGGVFFHIRPRAASGQLAILGFELPIRDLIATRFEVTPERPMDLVHDFAMEAGGAQVRTRGKLAEVFRPGRVVDTALSLIDAQRLLARVYGPIADGPAKVDATIRGPLTQPRIEARVREAAIGADSLRATEIEAAVVLDTSKPRLGFTGVEGKLLGGLFRGAGGLNLSNGSWTAKVDLRG